MGRKEGLKIARRGGVSKRGQVLGFGIVYRMRGRMKNDECGGGGEQEATKVATPRLENF